MESSLTSPSTYEHTTLKRARSAVFALFAINGFIIATWAVSIPSVQDRTGVSSSLLGSMLLILGLGALAGMQVVGPLIDRFGSARLATAAAITLGVIVPLPLLAPSPTVLAVGLGAFGFANGVLDISMNAQAVVVEKRYERPIMSAFHAMFSIAGVAGSGLGAAALVTGTPVWVFPVATALLAVLTAGVVSRHLLSAAIATPTNANRSADSNPNRPRASRILVLGLLAFLLFLSEGVATDWSSLQAREHLGVSAAAGGITYAVFAATMTAGRLAADRLSSRFGPVAIVRVGCLIAAVGLAIVMTSPAIAVTYVGWAMFGLGLSGSIPQIFSAAGSMPGSNGVTLSRVVGMGYVALLAGPSVIGWLTHFMPLTAALTVPLAAVLLCSLTARAVSPGHRGGSDN